MPTTTWCGECGEKYQQAAACQLLNSAEIAAKSTSRQPRANHNMVWRMRRKVPASSRVAVGGRQPPRSCRRPSTRERIELTPSDHHAGSPKAANPRRSKTAKSEDGIRACIRTLILTTPREISTTTSVQVQQGNGKQRTCWPPSESLNQQPKGAGRRGSAGQFRAHVDGASAWAQQRCRGRSGTERSRENCNLQQRLESSRPEGAWLQRPHVAGPRRAAAGLDRRPVRMQPVPSLINPDALHCRVAVTSAGFWTQLAIHPRQP